MFWKKKVEDREWNLNFQSLKNVTSPLRNEKYWKWQDSLREKKASSTKHTG